MHPAFDFALRRLREHADTEHLSGQAYFGKSTTARLGVKVPMIRALAKELGSDESLALALWGCGIPEARILACMVMPATALDVKMMNAWVADFDSWDVCDQTCLNLFCRSALAWPRLNAWAKQDSEYERRAAFALLACLAVHDKKAPDSQFVDTFPLIEAYAFDGRNFVKKAVNWALRQVGKRNAVLCAQAIECAHRVHAQASPSAKWIASDALRELQGRPNVRSQA